MRLLRLIFLSRRRRLELAGERARRLHSVWLTRALSDPSIRLPRIPVRPVAQGGFGPVTASPGGRRWAEGWWRGAFRCVDERP